MFAYISQNIVLINVLFVSSQNTSPLTISFEIPVSEKKSSSDAYIEKVTNTFNVKVKYSSCHFGLSIKINYFLLGCSQAKSAKTT